MRDWEDTLRRAGWTALQAALGPLIAFLATTETGVIDVDAGTQAVVIGVGAGLAAVLSLAKSIAAQEIEGD